MGSLGPTSLAVGLSLLHVEGSVADGSFAGVAGEALHVPGHLQCMHHLLEGRHCQTGAGPPRAGKDKESPEMGPRWEGTEPGTLSRGQGQEMKGRLRDTHPSDLLLALGTGGRIARVVALGAEDGAFLLKEATLIQHLPALAAGELLGVVIMSQRHEVPSPVAGQSHISHAGAQDAGVAVVAARTHLMTLLHL